MTDLITGHSTLGTCSMVAENHHCTRIWGHFQVMGDIYKTNDGLGSIDRVPVK